MSNNERPSTRMFGNPSQEVSEPPFSTEDTTQQPSLTGRTIPIEPEVSALPKRTSVLGNGPKEEKEGPSVVKGSVDDNVYSFICAVYDQWKIDLGTADIKAVSNITNTKMGAWQFYDTLASCQVMMTCQGFRKATTQGGGGSMNGVSGYLSPEHLGNVRNSQARSLQSRTVGGDEGQGMQAVNTLMSVLGRKLPFDVSLGSGQGKAFFNNGRAIPSHLFNRVRGKINQAKENGINPETLMDEEVQTLLECIYEDVNLFLNERVPRPFQEYTCSFFLGEQADTWLRQKASAGKGGKRAGSYYSIHSNTDTTAALTTATRTTALSNMADMQVRGSNDNPLMTGIGQGERDAQGRISNNAFTLTANNPIFKGYWKENPEMSPDELIKLCGNSQYNRSVTLPSDCLLLWFSSSPNPATQDMVGLLGGLLVDRDDNEEEWDKTEVENHPGASSESLLGALALQMMRRAGYPVKKCVNMERLQEVVNKYKLENIFLPPREEGDTTLGTQQELSAADHIKQASRKVARQEIEYHAAWLANLILGTIASQTQGAIQAFNRGQQTSEDAFGDVDQDDEEFGGFETNMSTGTGNSTPEVSNTTTTTPTSGSAPNILGNNPTTGSSPTA